jgi:hypothetical protein
MSTVATSQSSAENVEAYRYKHFTTKLLFRDLRFRRGSAKPCQAMPAFELITTDGTRLTNRDLFTDQPVLFVFGSMTCPMTASAAPSVQTHYEKFGDRVKFVMLYVREAHPGEYITQAESLEEKLQHARTLKQFYNIEWTVAADNVDGDLHRALDPKPNSAFLVDSSGKIIFRSLWAADRNALHEALDAAASGTGPKKTQSVTLLVPVARAMGQVHEVMKRGGPQAVRDLWRAGFPMTLAGRVATFFPRLTPDQRGIAAVLTLAIGMTATLYVLGALLVT